MPTISRKRQRVRFSAPAVVMTLFCAALAGRSHAQTSAPAASPTTPDAPLVTVTVKPTPGSPGRYALPDTSTALKVPAPIQDVPVSVQVVPRQLIQDRGVLAIDQATETVSGVERSVNFPNTIAFRLRGFDDSFESLRDGFREQADIFDVAGVSRVEVLKGPASVLYGSAQLSGGVVNVISKTPEHANFERISLSGGSFGLFRGTADVNRDVFGDGTLQVRVNGAYQRDDGFRSFGYNEKSFINPTIRWRPTDRDEVTLLASYLHTNFTFDQFQSPISRPILARPLSENFSNPDLGASHEDAWRLAYNWVHTFDSGIKFRSGFAASLANFNFGSERLYHVGFELEADNRTLDRTVSRGPQIEANYDLQNELSGVFQTGPLEHEWLLGLEAFRETYHYKNSFAQLTPLDILAPVYGRTTGPFALSLDGGSRADAVAGYVQDFVTVAPQVRVLVGGRYEAASTIGYDRLGDTRSANAANRFSPRIGITYKPAPATAIYGSWSNGFIPVTATAVGGRALQPITSEQYELGVKQQLWSERVQATLALFQITRANAPTLDINNPTFSIAAGRERSRGVEVDVAGTILPEWKIAASYAYTFANVTADAQIPVGSVLAGVAKHAGQVWSTYEWGEGSLLRGLGIGVGARAETSRQATLPNTFLLPGYVRLDAAAWYQFEAQTHPVRAQLNVQNITDARIYDTDGGGSLRPQAPLSFLGTISTEF